MEGSSSRMSCRIPVGELRETERDNDAKDAEDNIQPAKLKRGGTGVHKFVEEGGRIAVVIE